ncbi:hypothetical protein K6119_02120 [Paracrocinitomix mangrovi]|uniref:hypothetical protein n=1 Tax=Paracrocinitomix mangrovi TaxID=2862509 RepID=UPI001C8D476F|nr:hypothetical protein [Paracrocinitomix mangrovi]UKN02315.1 hypothetical protein K6119_02120 [Paracrocinitomix mangrovi]
MFKVKVLIVFTLVLLTSCSISIRQYAKAAKDLSDCVGGVKMPADEFCVEWNSKWADAREKMDKRLEGLKSKNLSKYERLKHKVEEVDSNFVRSTKIY